MSLCTRCAKDIATGPRPLSEREKQIVRLIARDFSNPEIGRALHICEKTVKNHLSRIFEVLDVDSRTGAVFAALDQEIITREEIRLAAISDPRAHHGTKLVHAPVSTDTPADAAA